jgi:16S rRNA (guanine966-N2)-methyltransferase
MRITGGVLGGRPVTIPKGDIRPTSERIREALFSSVAEAVPGARVLDLFAGSGMLGLEALSRGALVVWWVEKSDRTVKMLRQSVRTMSRGIRAETRVVRADVGGFLSTVGESEKVVGFDLILADPPYEKKWPEKILPRLEDGDILKPGGLLVLEQATREAVLEPETWELLRNKAYGDTRLLHYRLRKK